MFSGLAVAIPRADQVLNHPVDKEESEDAGKEKDPPKDCFWQPVYFEPTSRPDKIIHLGDVGLANLNSPALARVPLLPE